MLYPLFYPSCEPGWSINLSHVAEHATEHRNMVTLLQYYTCRWADGGRFNALRYGGMLTRQKMVETNRMDYIKKSSLAFVLKRVRVYTIIFVTTTVTITIQLIPIPIFHILRLEVIFLQQYLLHLSFIINQTT